MSLAAIKKSQHIHASLGVQGPAISCTDRNALWIEYIRVATLPSLILVPFAEQNRGWYSTHAVGHVSRSFWCNTKNGYGIARSESSE